MSNYKIRAPRLFVRALTVTAIVAASAAAFAAPASAETLSPRAGIGCFGSGFDQGIIAYAPEVRALNSDPLRVDYATVYWRASVYADHTAWGGGYVLYRQFDTWAVTTANDSSSTKTFTYNGQRTQAVSFNQVSAGVGLKVWNEVWGFQNGSWKTQQVFWSRATSTSGRLADWSGFC